MTLFLIANPEINISNFGELNKIMNIYSDRASNADFSFGEEHYIRKVNKLWSAFLIPPFSGCVMGGGKLI